MALWYNTDEQSSKPKFVDETLITGTLVFVDVEEAKNPNNIAAGLKTPGWWRYFSYTDSQGVIRNQAELIIPLKRSRAQAGDNDESTGPAGEPIVPNNAIIIDNLNDSAIINDGESYNIVTTVTSTPTATLSYQWQTYNGTSWVNLTNSGFYSGVSTNTLKLTTVDYSINGKKVRLKVSATGFKTMYSDIVTLVITPAKISIITQPQPTSAVGDTNAYFTVLANTSPKSGLAMTYQWMRKRISDNDWVIIPDGDQSALSFGSTYPDDNGASFKVDISRNGAKTVSSTPVKLTVTKP